MLSALHRRRSAPSRGQSMVEMALILPIFALFLVMTIDFGRVFFSYIQITNAAREAAAYGAGAPIDGPGITARANQEKNAQAQGGESTITVTSACSNAGGATITCASAPGGVGAGNRITVTVTEPFSFLTPLVDSFLGGFSLSTEATSNVLGYAAGSGTSPTCTTAPTASFTVVVVEDLTVQTDPSASSPNSGICNISGYNWSWGDGQSGPGGASSEQHTYGSANTYTITLQVTNPAGVHSTTRQITVSESTAIECDPPVANFSISENGKKHTYTDTSTVTNPTECFITDWRWTFGDGTLSNAQNPATVTYGNNGQHSTRLEVTNAGGTHAVTKSH